MEASISNPPFEVKKLYIFQHFSLLLLDSRQKLFFSRQWPAEHNDRESFDRFIRFIN